MPMVENKFSIDRMAAAQKTAWARENFEKREALVAFVDILGFSQIGCTKFEPKEDPNFAVLQELQNCKEKTFSGMRDKYHQLYIGTVVQVDEDKVEEIPPQATPDDTAKVRFSPEKYVSVYVFSDSFVVICPLDEGNDESESIKWAKVDTFFEFCSELNKSMFEAGLPLRGAITYGDIYWPKQGKADASKGVSLLGRAFIEAHDFGERIDAATIAVCPSAENFLLKSGRMPSAFSGVTNAKICLPLKTEKYYCMRTNLLSDGLIDSVKTSFSKWGKSIAGCESKIRNTVNVFRAFK